MAATKEILFCSARGNAERFRAFEINKVPDSMARLSIASVIFVGATLCLPFATLIGHFAVNSPDTSAANPSGYQSFHCLPRDVRADEAVSYDFKRKRPITVNEKLGELRA